MTMCQIQHDFLGFDLLSLKVEGVISADLLLFSFPCQPESLHNEKRPDVS